MRAYACECFCVRVSFALFEMYLFFWLCVLLLVLVTPESSVFCECEQRRERYFRGDCDPLSDGATRASSSTECWVKEAAWKFLASNFIASQLSDNRRSLWLLSTRWTVPDACFRMFGDDAEVDMNYIW